MMSGNKFLGSVSLYFVVSSIYVELKLISHDVIIYLSLNSSKIVDS